MYKISEHFCVKEFTKKETISKQEKYLLENLCDNLLEPIRELFDEPIIITSGIRDIADDIRLSDLGYKPSKSSDHHYGWGYDYKEIGTGAADFIVSGVDTEKVYKTIIENIIKKDFLKDNYEYLFGQIIYEKQNIKGEIKEWIHISNHSGVIYNKSYYDKFQNKQRFFEKEVKCGSELPASTGG